ncbi:gliding motility-associated C-terminal domain-containing protein, partial [Psychroflexus sp. C1]|nr:gliding motility-associated C-terminal domain-containing protein [Psychroflexus maritimus]
NSIYTFTPNSDECAESIDIEIEIIPSTTPEFSIPSEICENDPLVLPETSDNNIEGEWTPEIDNTTSTTYTFLPAEDECAETIEFEVIVLPNTTPEFSFPDVICEDEIEELPTTANNGIEGEWAPELSSSISIYTFTPNSDECAESIEVEIEIIPNTTPEFSIPSEICENELQELPTTSNNGIEGEWTPELNSSNSIYT